MPENSKRKRRSLKVYISVINYRTLIAVLLAFIATWVSYQYKLIYNLDLTLISVAVVFPLVFTLGSAFQRREKALEHLGRAKGALAAIKYSFSFARRVSEEDKQGIYEEINNVKTELIQFLYSDSDDKELLNNAIGKIQGFIIAQRENMGRSLALRVYRLMRDVIMGVENTIAIKVHRTPYSIRAYCKLFIYVFPFFYAPTLIKNIQYAQMDIETIFFTPSPPHGEEHLTWIIYGLNMVISFFLITLYNVQEQIENPFDQHGIDDIILKNYEIDY